MNEGSAYPSHTRRLSVGVPLEHDPTNKTIANTANNHTARFLNMLPSKMFLNVAPPSRRLSWRRLAPSAEHYAHIRSSFTSVLPPRTWADCSPQPAGSLSRL